MKNRRRSTLILLSFIAVILFVILLAGAALTERAGGANFAQKNLSPCPAHPFGTDWMGRDMLSRTLAGLSLSLRVGVLTAMVSTVIALSLGTASAALGGGWTGPSPGSSTW